MKKRAGNQGSKELAKRDFVIPQTCKRKIKRVGEGGEYWTLRFKKVMAEEPQKKKFQNHKLKRDKRVLEKCERQRRISIPKFPWARNNPPAYSGVHTGGGAVKGKAEEVGNNSLLSREAKKSKGKGKGEIKRKGTKKKGDRVNMSIFKTAGEKKGENL